MAERQRQPLTERNKGNMPQLKGVENPAGGKARAASKAGDGLVDGALKVRRSVLELRKDLAKAREKFATNAPITDSTIPLTSTPNDTFEVRFQHLVQKHQSSKAKYTAKVEELNVINATLHKACSAAKTELEVLQAENARVTHELEQAKATLKTHAQAQTKERDDGVDALKWEIEILSLENKRLVDREDKVEEMEDEREWLETVVQIAARQCGRDHLTMVDGKVYQRVKRELESLNLDRMTERSEVNALQRRLQVAQEECSALRFQLGQAELQRKDAEEMIGDLLDQRQRDRALPLSGMAPVDQISDLDSAVEDSEIGVLEATHADIELISTQEELRQTLEAHRGLMIKYESLKEKYASNEASLNSLQTTNLQLQDKCAGLEGVRDVAEQRIMDLQQEVARWQHAETASSTELSRLKGDHRRLEIAAKGDREALKRANESVMRAKSAEDALAEQVTQLSEALDRAAPFEVLYNDLLDENNLLITREHLAAEEAEKLGIRNAELIGRANGDQKISYVESVRREMAIAKHELASTRHQLNQANDKLRELSEEVEAYKTVGGGLGFNASTRTRIVRRVPEGSWLGKSVRGTSRSVSGPVSR